MGRIQRSWERFWMGRAGLSRGGRLATRLACVFAPPYMARFYLARMTPRPFIDPEARVHHRQVSLGSHVFIADRVLLYQAKGGGPVSLDDRVHVLRDSVLETGEGGSINVGKGTFLHPRAQLMAYLGDVNIGRDCTVAPGCAFYAYNHGTQPGQLVKEQPVETRGGIRVGDGVWIGFGVMVADGVTIGDGAVIGAGAVVTRDIPDNAIAAGNPARVIRFRDDADRSKDVEAEPGEQAR